jgi:sugar phosphate isomerase/epimerase
MKDAMSRRSFLGKAAGAVGALAASAGAPGAARAIEPFARAPARKVPLSCAAYSLRKHLDLKKPTMTLEDFIVKCAEWGTDGVELTEYYFPKPVSRSYVSRLKRHALLWGQEITGTPVGNNFALPPGPDRDREVEAVKGWIQVSADLGSPAIRIFAGGAPKGVDEPQARKWVVECIEACCETATRRGVFLALENHGGVVATADGMLEIVRAVGCPWFGVNLDTGNFHSSDPYEEMARCAPYAVTCQVKTEVSPAGGKKEEVSIEKVVEILRKASYRGYVTLEYEGAEEPLEAVPKYLAEMRKFLAG